MGNSEILGFQFEPAKALQPDSDSGKSWKTCSSGDSEPTSTRQKEASVTTWCMCFNCNQMPATNECVCYNELNACEYFKIKRCIYLLTILQILFIKLINEHTVISVIINLIIILRNGKFFPFLRTIFNKLVSFSHIA